MLRSDTVTLRRQAKCYCSFFWLRGVTMGTRGRIRNPQAFEKSQEKKRRAFEKKVSDAKFHIVAVLHRHFDGKLEAGTQDEAFDKLIAKGSLGAMVSSRRIARVVKQQHQTHQQLSHKDRYRRDDAARAIDEAIEQLEAAGKLTITVSDHRTVLVAIEPAEHITRYTMAYSELADEGDLDVYDAYDPRKYIRTGRAKVDNRIYE